MAAAAAAAIVLIPSGNARAEETLTAEANSPSMAEMKATLDSIQAQIAKIADLAGTAKPAEPVAAPPAETATDLKAIAAEVNRIAKEKDDLAVKVQLYVAAHPAAESLSESGMASNSENREALATIAALKAQIADLQAKADQKKEVTEVALVPDAAVSVAPSGIVAVPQGAPSGTDTTVQSPTTGTSETPAIGQPLQGTAADTTANAETKTAQPQKGLIQSVSDYIKSLFKF